MTLDCRSRRCRRTLTDRSNVDPNGVKRNGDQSIAIGHQKSAKGRLVTIGHRKQGKGSIVFWQVCLSNRQRGHQSRWNLRLAIPSKFREGGGRKQTRLSDVRMRLFNRSRSGSSRLWTMRVRRIPYIAKGSSFNILADSHIHGKIFISAPVWFRQYPRHTSRACAGDS